MEPDTGHGFDERGRLNFTAFTVSRVDSLSLRLKVPSVKVVVSWPTVTSECVRDCSTGGCAVLNVLASVSFEIRCTTPVQLFVVPPSVLLVPLRATLISTWVTIFRTELSGVQLATTAPFAS